MVEHTEVLDESGAGDFVGNCMLGAVKVISRRTFNELIYARGLLADWNNLAHAKHWPQCL